MEAERDRLRRRRVRTPTLLQMEAAECGAAALGIVLAYHGRHLTLEVLRIECGVSRDGSKASNVLKAARKFGLEARGFKKEPADLRELAPPFIVFWNFNHFLVVEGFSPGQVHLNDPATGPRSVSDQEFDESFTGVALVLTPGPDFKKGGSKRSLWQGLAGRLAGSRTALVYVVLVGLALVVPGLAIPTFGRVFVDQILVSGLSDWTRPLVAALALTALMRGALTYLQQRFLLRLETKIALTSSSRFFWHLLHLPTTFFSQRYAADLASRVGLNDTVAQLLSEQLATTLLSIVMVVFYVALMLQYDVLLTALGVGIALVNVLALRRVSRRRRDENQKLLQESAKLMATSMQSLQIIETIKASGAEADAFSRWAGYQTKVANAEQKLQTLTRFLLEVPPLLMAVDTVAILGVGSLRVMDGHLSMGMLVAFQSLMASFLRPVNDLVGLGGTLQEVEASVNRLDDVLSYRTDPLLAEREAAVGAAEPERAEPVRLSGRLALCQVRFGYSRLEPPLVDALDLDIKPGSRVALVGASGSGKSTVARLVCGLYEPWEGEILFDGKPAAAVARRLLTSSLAMVDQDIFLIEGSIRDNLTLWDTTIPEAALVQAARDACIHDDILARPGGYDGHVAEGGRNFSGGQRQRLEIARALAGNPSILVLDEATSALDPRTEAQIDDNLRRRGCTALVIAHRLSTFRDCDEIVMLDRGRVVERGRHESMRENDGPYRRLIEEA